MIELIETDTVPEALLQLEDATRIRDIFPHPALLRLEGERREALFVTVLLHGNEDTGLFAIQALLKKYARRKLPRTLLVFFGNVYAAAEGLRRLPGQPDYNRVWPGGSERDSDEADLIDRVTARVTAEPLFASIDIHNNTGKNPHYGCINRLTPDFLQLASLFSRTVVYFETPRGVQSLAMAEHCPAVTVECGKPGEARGTEHAASFVETLLHLEAFAHHPPRRDEIDVYHTAVQVKIPDRYTFSFTDKDADLHLLAELENDNFTELPEGTLFAARRPGSEAHFEAFDDEDRERSRDYFIIESDEIRLKKAMMPSMITLDERVIRQDCFCYLMERVVLPEG